MNHLEMFKNHKSKINTDSFGAKWWIFHKTHEAFLESSDTFTVRKMSCEISG